MENTSEENKSAWNLSQQLIVQIGYLLQSSSTYWLQGKPKDCYHALQEVKNLCWTDLSPAERAKLAKLERRISGVLRAATQKIDAEGSFYAKISGESRSWKHEIRIRAYALYRDFIILYRQEIMELLGKYGYLVQRRADSKRIA